MTLADEFLALTGREPEGLWSAPGRVNLIGEHTDYNDGFVLPFALPLRTTAGAARNRDGVIRVWSRQRDDGPVVIRLSELAPGRPAGWAGYVAGVVWALRESGCAVGGIDVVIDSGVPVGSGLSSSAALECAVGLAACDLHDIALPALDLARIAQVAENRYVGVPCGLMDQMASMTATAGHACFFDVRSGSVEQVPFDPAVAGLTLLVIDTHAKHDNSDGAYAERRAACEEAARLLGVTALRDAGPDAVERLDDPLLRRRARHIVGENQRVLATVDLLRHGRVDEIGPLLTASHASLRDDYDVSAPELDTVVAAALGAGALGARMTGAGFGGCAIALVTEDLAAAVSEAVANETARRRFPSPTVFPAVPSAGAHRDTPLAANARLDHEEAPAWRP